MVQRKHILADLHTHLNEKNIDPKKYWEAVQEKKLSVIAITEHAEYEPETAYLKLKEIKPKNVILIPGMEAKTTAGHLLIFGEDEGLYKIKPLQKLGVPIETALELIKQNHLTSSFSHPYGYKVDSTCSIIGEQKTRELLRKYKVGVEYYNGMLGSANNLVFGTEWVKKLYNFFDFTEKSSLAKKLFISNKSGKIKAKLEKISLETLERVRKAIIFSKNASFITAGSDAHYPRTIGTAIIELKKKPRNEKEFLEMIRKKEIVWAGPNTYTNDPVERLKKKEILEGLKYLTKKRIQRKIVKGQITNKIGLRKVKRLAKRIKNKKVAKTIKKKLW